MKQSRRSAAALPLAIGAASLLALTSLAACSRERAIVMHPISGEDIVLVDSGAVLRAPKSGAFVSDYYIEQVMKVRVDR